MITTLSKANIKNYVIISKKRWIENPPKHSFNTTLFNIQ